MVGPNKQFNSAACFVVSLVSVHHRRSFAFDSLSLSLSLRVSLIFLTHHLLSLSFSLRERVYVCVIVCICTYLFLSILFFPNIFHFSLFLYCLSERFLFPVLNISEKQVSLLFIFQYKPKNEESISVLQTPKPPMKTTHALYY